MVKVLGESGRYVSNQVVASFHGMHAVAFITVAALAAIAGFLICFCLLRRSVPPVVSITAPTAFLAVDFLVWRVASWKLNVFEKTRVDMRRGVTGEAIVAATLEDLPDEFCVINDPTTDSGNLDHVMVGPTGVFIIDAKNWRGIVTPDGQGDLLLNGRRPDDIIKPFLGRLMKIREKVRVLVPETNPFFQALFAFTSAKVDAPWGKTGNVLCMRDDQLVNFEFLGVIV